MNHWVAWTALVYVVVGICFAIWYWWTENDDEEALMFGLMWPVVVVIFAIAGLCFGVLTICDMWRARLYFPLNTRVGWTIHSWLKKLPKPDDIL
jgi:apolipoprotein N-acyltransferase